ncbi:hypothetical protein DXG03_001030, partial [Asterophora parasitica]
MSENLDPIALPPKRQRRTHETPSRNPLNGTPDAHLLSPSPCVNSPHTPTPLHRKPLADKKNRKSYQNGFETKPKTPSYKPYLNNPGHPRRNAFAFGNFEKLSPRKALDSQEWNTRAIESGGLRAGQELREFQIESANFVLSRAGDLCVFAPTGSGKPKLQVLPLLVQEKAVSLVVIPFTSLGYQGEER